MTFTDQIKSLVKIKGSLTIAEFMQEALFNPVHGYYQKKNPIGKEGDFTTAPEISQVFGELIGLYFLNLFGNAKRPIAVVEMGAGRGVLFRDLLLMAEKLAKNNIAVAQNFLQKSTFHIIEISPALQEEQKKTLAKIGVSIKWHKDFQSFVKELKTNEEIYFVANELFDCFPINQFVKTPEGWCEKVVSLRGEELDFFVEKFNPLKDKLINELVTLELAKDIAQNAVFEYSSSAVSFMKDLSESLRDRGGIGLIIDYGYSKNEFKDSLQSVKGHKPHDCLKSVGDADLTSLVNFPILEQVAKDISLNSSLVSQKELLEGLGVEDRRKILLLDKSKEQQDDINSRINRLIEPSQMGELFKCLIIWK